jgi:hypothetical protein
MLSAAASGPRFIQMRLFSRLSNQVTAAAYLVAVIFLQTSTASDYLDVSGMKAIDDANTGNLRFEGLFNIQGIGIGRNDKFANCLAQGSGMVCSTHADHGWTLEGN